MRDRMRNETRGGLVALLAVVASFLTRDVPGDEGMWLFNRLPEERLAERHGFRAPDGWAERVMRSCVRVSRGGSGSIVSSSGLILTNHHVVSGILQDLSTPERNLLEEGFLASSADEELRCPNTEILALREIEDVTALVSGVVRPGMAPADAEKARRAKIAEIEQAAKEATGLHCEVVTLYRGGEYHLYRYRRYDDVRLVMAPEVGAAFFGGDADNFEFPRWCLDMSFLRIWEDGRPAKVEDWLRWSRRGVKTGDLVFVAGHPGSTQRLNTVDHLRFLRDTVYPGYLELLYRREVALQQYSLRGAEERRQARDDLFSIQNSRKALRGILAGLHDPAIFSQKMASEAVLRGAVARDSDLGASLEDWSRIAQAMDAYVTFYPETSFIEGGRAFWSDLFGTARTMVRLVEEQAKPNAERLPEYRDAVLPRTRMRLFSPAPIHADLEIARLSDSLTHFAGELGGEHPLVDLVLDGKSPSERAWELVSSTRLGDVDERKRLVESGVDGVASSDDPMVRLARAVDPFARDLRRRYESLVKEVRTQAYARISRAAFGLTGTDVYPDATFTLRLAFGVVRGWKEGGKEIPPFTRMAGAYRKFEAAGGEDPYELPESWIEARSRLDLSTHFNFVSTVDIIGGNSGSPVIDRAGDVVGLIFDGNIHGLVLDIAYTEEKARAVSVNAEAILEALREIYRAERLVTEIVGP